MTREHTASEPFDELLGRIEEIEAKKNSRGDWLKIIFGMIASISLVIGATLMDIGGYRENMSVLNRIVRDHIEDYEPKKAEKIQELERRMDVNTERIVAINKSLDEIKQQNAEIMRMLRRGVN